LYVLLCACNCAAAIELFHQALLIWSDRVREVPFSHFTVQRSGIPSCEILPAAIAEAFTVECLCCSRTLKPGGTPDIRIHPLASLQNFKSHLSTQGHIRNLKACATCSGTVAGGAPEATDGSTSGNGGGGGGANIARASSSGGVRALVTREGCEWSNFEQEIHAIDSSFVVTRPPRHGGPGTVVCLLFPYKCTGKSVFQGE
jgi:hypothetical protein